MQAVMQWSCAATLQDGILHVCAENSVRSQRHFAPAVADVWHPFLSFRLSICMYVLYLKFVTDMWAVSMTLYLCLFVTDCGEKG